MAEFVVNQEMTKTVLRKRAASENLSAEEEQYSRKLFDYMMTGHKSVMKTVKIVVGGQEIRKDVSATPTRSDEHPRQVEIGRAHV